MLQVQTFISIRHSVWHSSACLYISSLPVSARPLTTHVDLEARVAEDPGGLQHVTWGFRT